MNLCGPVSGAWLVFTLSLTEEEDEVIGVNDEIVTKARSGFRFCLLGKLITRRSFHKGSFSEYDDQHMERSKGLMGRGLEISEISNDVLLFSFPNVLQ